MSVRTMARVWERSEHRGSELLMLLAIADFADDGGRAYPAVPTLATKCRTTPRHANRILANLRDSGELQIRLNEGPRGTNLYLITLTPTSPLTCASPLTPTSATPDIQVPKPLTPTSDEPSLNRQEPKRARSFAENALPEVEPQLLKDWEKQRKAQKVGPVTATIAKILIREASKADVTIGAAVEACIEYGWKNFNAGWYEERRTVKTNIFEGAR